MINKEITLKSFLNNTKIALQNKFYCLLHFKKFCYFYHEKKKVDSEKSQKKEVN